MALTKVSYSMINGAVFNILDYGAIADYDENTPGSGTDNSAAIQAAVDAASANSTYNKGAVYIPAGAYKIESTIEIPYGVSIFGEGATASILFAEDCDGLTFITYGTSSGSVFFQDFGLTATTGTNRTAILTLPNASTMDGLYFQRLRLYNWNIGISLGANWSSEINECVIHNVNIAVDLSRSNGEVVKLNIINNSFIYSSGGLGTADHYGINFNGTSKFTEGVHIVGNNIYGFVRAINVLQALYVTILDNDLNASEACINFGTPTSGYYVSNNYIETFGIGIVITPTNDTDLSRYALIDGNSFVGLTGATFGVSIGISDSSVHGGSVTVTNNLFGGFATADIRGFNIVNVKMLNNICNSTAVTYNILITSAVTYLGSTNVVANNYCKKAIYVDATVYANGLVQLIDNAENSVFRALRQSAAPTTGTWRVGDIVYNTAPATGAYIGWVCTVAGTPGTWKPYGLIA